MQPRYKIFVINPGSTTTKIALFENDEKLFAKTVDHDAAELSRFKEIRDQLPYRLEMILSIVSEAGIDLKTVDAFAGRGGSLVALEGGTYPVNDILLTHARTCYTIKHPAALGSQIAHALAEKFKAKAFVVNPPDVDEFIDEARITGFKEIYRESRSHPLNHKEVAMRYAHSIGKHYADLNLVIAHIGGGISIAAHQKGKMIDSTDATQGDGPMAPTRSGAIPTTPLIKMCFSGEYSEKQMLDKIIKLGGLVDHLGTSDVRNVTQMAETNVHAKRVFSAMIYQIVKYIGAYAAVLKGQVDAILLTGGVAHASQLVDDVRAAVEWIAPVFVYAGEFEMEALASGVIRVLSGEEQPKTYTGIPCWDGFDNA